MKKRSLIVLAAILLIVAGVVVGCKPTTGEDVVIDNITIGDKTPTESGGSVQVDNNEKTIIMNVAYATESVAVAELSLGEGLNFRLYSDKEMTTTVTGNLALVVGNNDFYAKVWKNDESKSVTYKLTIVRAKESGGENPDNPDNPEDPDDSDDPDNPSVVPPKGEVTTSNITLAEIKTVVMPLMKKFSEACGDGKIEDLVADTLDDPTQTEMLLEMMRAGGFTVEQLQAVVISAGDYCDKFIEETAKIYSAYVKGENFTELLYKKEFLADAMAVLKALFNGFKAEQIQAAAIPFLKDMFLSTEINYYEKVEDSDWMRFSQSGSRWFYEKDSKTLFGGELAAMLETAQGWANHIIGASQSDETYYAGTALLNALKSVCDMDAEKLSDTADIVMKVVFSENIGDVLAGQGGISYKDMVAAINTAGNLINTFLKGLGDFTKFEDALQASVVDMVRAVGVSVYEIPSVNGACGVVKFVADVMENITTATVTDLYMDFDDYAKEANADKQSEKFGYLAVKICGIIKEDYAKLDKVSKDFLVNIVENQFGMTVDTDAVDATVSKATAKSADEFTSEELTAIAKEVMGLLSVKEKAPQLDAYSYAVPFVAVGADKEALIAAMEAAACEIIGSSGNSVDLTECELTYDNSKEGYFDVTIKYDGKSDTLKCYAFDESSKDKFKFAPYFAIPGLSFAKGTATEADIKALIEDVSPAYDGRFVDEYGNIIFVVLECDLDNATVYGFDSNTLGERGGILKANYGGLKDIYVPFVYNVYDAADMKVTSVYFSTYEETVVEGTELNVSATVTYEYAKKVSLDADALHIQGYDKNKLGAQTITLSCAINGKTYSENRTVKVLSKEEAREIERIETYEEEPKYRDPNTWDTKPMGELYIGDDVDNLKIYIYISFKKGSIHAYDVADLKAELEEYGYVLKHNIDTSKPCENESYRIWIEDEEENEIEVLYSGQYTVTEKTYKTVYEIYDAVQTREIKSFIMQSDSADFSATVAFDGNTFMLMIREEEVTNGILVFMEEETCYSIYSDGRVIKNNVQDPKDMAYTMCARGFRDEDRNIVPEKEGIVYAWTGEYGYEHGIIVNDEEEVKAAIEGLFPMPDVNYKEVAEEGYFEY